MDLFKKDQLAQIGKKLIAQKETVAVAESVTAGAIQLAISSIMDAGKFYQGGITAYNIAQKYKHLGVEPIHALEVNCVSEKVAGEMALNVLGLFNSDWGIAITGYASPVPESDNQVFAYYAIAYKGKVKESGKIDPSKDESLDLQVHYTNEVCRSFNKCLAAK